MDDRSREDVRERSSTDEGQDDSGREGVAFVPFDRDRDSGRAEFVLPEPEEAQERDFAMVPPGTYVCRVEDARSRFTRAGDPLWALKWVIDEGPDTGRVAAWDNVVFSKRAAARARKVLQAIGLEVSGTMRLGPHDFIGRRAILEILVGGFEHPASGTFVRRNEVAYDGVRRLENAGTEDGSDIPF